MLEILISSINVLASTLVVAGQARANGPFFFFFEGFQVYVTLKSNFGAD